MGGVGLRGCLGGWNLRWESVEGTFLGCDVDPLWRGNGYIYMERIQMFLIIPISSFFFSFLILV